jgi:hypothetical protein
MQWTLSWWTIPTVSKWRHGAELDLSTLNNNKACYPMMWATPSTNRDLYKSQNTKISNILTIILLTKSQKVMYYRPNAPQNRSFVVFLRLISSVC